MKYLLISSTGGSGHLQAARAKRAALLREDPDAEIVEVDLMQDLFGCGLGPLFVNAWNKAQKGGRTHSLELFAKLVLLFDILSFLPVYRRLLRLLLREKFDRIFDLQPCATPAIICAAKQFHRITGRRLLIEKYLIEFPTDKVFQYFKPIRRLKEKERAYLRLITLPPLASDATAFWQTHCRLSPSQVTYCTPLIRDTFTAYADKQRDPTETFRLAISIPNPIERLHIQQALHKGPLHYTPSANDLIVDITPDFRVVTLMLGSQPARKATLAYVDHFIALAASTTAPIALFVFCANQMREDIPLVEAICQRALRCPSFPKNLSILPMPYQDDHIIAPLYHRSDATITRSGGVTSMELSVVARGKIWIHTEKPLKKETLKIWGMPSWEEGNANYLQAKHGAELVCPATFAAKWAPFFEKERELTLL